MAGYELDEIQRHVVQHFIDIPSIPLTIVNNIPPSDGIIVNNVEDNCITNLRPYGLPFHSSSLAKVYRIIPVCNYHLLTLTWQCPSIITNWRTKPADYLAHLLGHEASGSILSVLKDRGLATTSRIYGKELLTSVVAVMSKHKLPDISPHLCTSCPPSSGVSHNNNLCQIGIFSSIAQCFHENVHD